MVWVKIDDSILDNPKIIRSGPVGFALHMAAITWSARNLMDGFIPEAKAKQLLSRTWSEPADETGKEVIWELNAGSGHAGMCASEVIESVINLLVYVELWHEGEDQYGNRGYWLNDFTDFNPTRAEVLKKRVVRATAGKVGGKQTQTRRQAKSKQDASKDSSINQPPYPDPVPDPVSPNKTSGSERLPCPGDLALEPSQRATLETYPIPGWGIDAITITYVAKYVGNERELRTLDEWRRGLVTTITSVWNDSSRRPRKPDAENDRDAEARNAAARARSDGVEAKAKAAVRGAA